MQGEYQRERILREEIGPLAAYSARYPAPSAPLKFPALTADETGRRRGQLCFLTFSKIRSCCGMCWRTCRWGFTSWTGNGGSVFWTLAPENLPHSSRTRRKGTWPQEVFTPPTSRRTT